jgi:hypothetical protein
MRRSHNTNSERLTRCLIDGGICPQTLSLILSSLVQQKRNQMTLEEAIQYRLQMIQVERQRVRRSELVL